MYMIFFLNLCYYDALETEKFESKTRQVDLVTKAKCFNGRLRAGRKSFHKLKERKTMEYGVLSENTRKLKAYEHRCIRHKAYLYRKKNDMLLPFPAVRAVHTSTGKATLLH